MFKLLASFSHYSIQLKTWNTKNQGLVLNRYWMLGIEVPTKNFQVLILLREVFEVPVRVRVLFRAKMSIVDSSAVLVRTDVVFLKTKLLFELF